MPLLGHVREAALARAARTEPEALAEVLPWWRSGARTGPPPVRDRAREVLADALARPLPPRILAATAGAVLAVAGRLRGGAALALLGDALDQAGQATVEALLTAEDRATRRFAKGLLRAARRP